MTGRSLKSLHLPGINHFTRLISSWFFTYGTPNLELGFVCTHIKHFLVRYHGVKMECLDRVERVIERKGIDTQRNETRGKWGYSITTNGVYMEVAFTITTERVSNRGRNQVQ